MKPPTVRDDHNARAARLAGWTYLDRGTQLPGWLNPVTIEREWDCPDYSTSMDSIRRDLLPLLTDEQWYQIEHELSSRRDSHPYTRFVFAIPAETLLAAVVEILERR